MQRHVIDTRGQELDEAERRHRGDIGRRDLDPGILGDQDASPRPRRGPVRRREIGQEQQLAVGAELLPVGGAHGRRRVVGDKDARRDRNHPGLSVKLKARGSRGRRGHAILVCREIVIRPQSDRSTVTFRNREGQRKGGLVRGSPSSPLIHANSTGLRVAPRRGLPSQSEGTLALALVRPRSRGCTINGKSLIVADRRRLGR